jgi:uncharacterized protein (TIGR02284 family)
VQKARGANAISFWGDSKDSETAVFSKEVFMTHATTTTDTLNSLLRGELSAVETYDQALGKLGDTKGAVELRRIHSQHREAAAALRKHVEQHGGQPDKSSGAWGAFAKTVEGTAKLFGNDAALKALKEGEEHGISAYEKALEDRFLPADCATMIKTKLLPQVRAHIPVLDRLMAGLVERIPPQEAKQHLGANRGAMLVCAYDDEEKFRQHHLEGAISLQEFEAQVESVPRNREIIFYCA